MIWVAYATAQSDCLDKVLTHHDWHGRETYTAEGIREVGGRIEPFVQYVDGPYFRMEVGLPHHQTIIAAGPNYHEVRKPDGRVERHSRRQTPPYRLVPLYEGMAHDANDGCTSLTLGSHTLEIRHDGSIRSSRDSIRCPGVEKLTYTNGPHGHPSLEWTPGPRRKPQSFHTQRWTPSVPKGVFRRLATPYGGIPHDLPLVDHGSRVAVTGVVDGTLSRLPISMLVDTGAYGVVLPATVGQTVGVDHHRRGSALGRTQWVRTILATLPAVTVGSLVRQDPEITFVERASIFGRGGLGKNTVWTFDFSIPSLVLSSAADAPLLPVPEEVPFDWVCGSPHVQATVGWWEGWWTLDTGADTSTRYADAIEWEQRFLENATGVFASGIEGLLDGAVEGTAPPIQVGSTTVHGKSLLLLPDIEHRSVEGDLGMDLLRCFDIQVDAYANRAWFSFREDRCTDSISESNATR